MDLGVRDRLSPLAFSPRVVSTALAFVTAKASVHHFLAPFVAAIAAVLFKRWVALDTLEIWVGANAVFAIGWFVLKRFAFSNIRVESGWLIRRIALFAAYSACSSAVFASVGVFAWIPGAAENNYLILMLLCGQVSIAIFTLMPIMALVLIGALPPLLVMLAMPLFNELTDGIAVSALCALYLAGLACVTYVMRLKALESIRLREERADLVAELSDRVANLEGERDAAIKAQQETVDFVIQISHDLRVPLNSILGFSEVLRDEILGPLGHSPYVRLGGDIHVAGSELSQIVGNLQQVLTIEAGRVQLDPERLNVDLVLTHAIRSVKMRADGRRVRMTCHVPGGFARLWADRKAVDTMLDHLLNFAISRCEEKGIVSASVGMAPDGGVLMRILASAASSVRSRPAMRLVGAGPDAHSEVQSDLWRPIAQGLAELHGGALTTEECEDGGTLILVAFPPERTVALSSILTSPAAA